MKKIPLLLSLATLITLGTGCTQPPSLNTQKPNNPGQLGVNFIRFFMAQESAGQQSPRMRESEKNELDTKTSYLQPEAIFEEFEKLGIQSYRQFIKADLLWDVIEPENDQWNFTGTDAVLLENTSTATPIVTLFSLQYASPTPPWTSSPQEFEKELTEETKEYLLKIIERYGDVVTYWELGNEMDHWKAADPEETQGKDSLPASYPLNGFTPQEQGIFLKQAADFIRSHDEDAIIVMPGMGSPASTDWYEGVLETAGPDTFDIVNYHYYGDMERYSDIRQKFNEILIDSEMDGKPVWLTETGTTWSQETAQIRDRQGEASEESQAADIFRRIIPAYSHGDDLVMWHTFIGSPVMAGNEWGGFGILSDKGEPMQSYYTFALLANEVIPFKSVEKISEDAQGINTYRITTENGEIKYVAWGTGTFQVPENISQATSVITNTENFTWNEVDPGQTLRLNSIPTLFK